MRLGIDKFEFVEQALGLLVHDEDFKPYLVSVGKMFIFQAVIPTFIVGLVIGYFIGKLI